MGRLTGRCLGCCLGWVRRGALLGSGAASRNSSHRPLIGQRDSPPRRPPPQLSPSSPPARSEAKRTSKANRIHSRSVAFRLGVKASVPIAGCGLVLMNLQESNPFFHRIQCNRRHSVEVPKEQGGQIDVKNSCGTSVGLAPRRQDSWRGRPGNRLGRPSFCPFA